MRVKLVQAVGFFLSMLCLTGCFFQQSLPAWAVHLPSPAINPEANLDAYEGRLTAELKNQQLPRGFTTAEQIGILAAKELKAGNDWDATLLLSLASYRYFQEAINVLFVAKNIPSHVTVNKEAYDSLIQAELNVLVDLDFGDELDYLSANLQRDKNLAIRFENDYWKMMTTENAQRRDVLNKKLADDMDEAYTPPTEKLHHTQLAKAFQSRLVADMNSEYYRNAASYYLAITPLDSFRKAALANAKKYFFPPLCRQLAKRLKTDRQWLVDALNSSNGPTRSNAAIVLGLKPSEENKQLLEQKYAQETDPKARLAFEFALLQNGHDEFFDRLVGGVTQCNTDNGICNMVIALLQWLPLEYEERIDQRLLARVLGNAKNTQHSRMFAAIILGDIGQKHTLKKSVVTTLISVSEEKNDRDGLTLVAVWSTKVIENLGQLSRERIIARLDTNPRHQAALISRLSNVATEQDIVFLQQQARSLGTAYPRKQEAVINAISAIKGTGAASLLIECFRHYKQLRVPIALSMVKRADTRFKEQEELAKLDEQVAAAVLRMGMESSSDSDGPSRALPLVKQILSKGSIEQRVQMAKLVVLFDKTETIGDLLQLVRFENSNNYPADAYVRHAALISIIRFQIMINERRRNPKTKSVPEDPRRRITP